jgi:hypothetical protein
VIGNAMPALSPVKDLEKILRYGRRQGQIGTFPEWMMPLGHAEADYHNQCKRQGSGACSMLLRGDLSGAAA